MDSGQGARDLEAEATALLASLPANERPDVLMPDQIRRRQRREFLVPVLALREGGSEVPGDSEQVFAEFEICQRVLDAADLSVFERIAYLLHAQNGLSDQAIAFVMRRHRVTVTRYRTDATRKVQRVVAGLTECLS
jgi:DNA-directed RNA polymerase specialized sigma24 family protein